MKNIFPIIITSKLVECKQFYEDLFGFKCVFEAEWYVQLVHECGVEVAFMAPNLENQPETLQEAYNGQGFVLLIEVEDAASEYERLQEQGALIVFELKSEEWGQKHCMLRDPAGVIVDVVEQLES